ncbi:GyrI-like domain-containing protein [Paenibacillus puerhi]|uniref:GyrI-like domain-containing protein n=1 Tax=Paenibacillus puerhi TaxID=2692622 RepID=UPI001358F8A1|nr:GyrI-like domain-containing protein [Paenibacillus puerhi]
MSMRTMTPEIRKVDALHVVGMEQNHKFVPGGPIDTIVPQWIQFMERIGEIEDLTGVTLGISLCDKPEPSDTLDYAAGALVSGRPSSVPDGMKAYELKPQTYAAFLHKGAIASLGDTYRAIYSWIGSNGAYTRAPAPEFERYDERYTGSEDEHSEFEIYIPVIPAG